MKHITELEKHGEKEKGEMTLKELEEKLISGDIVWQTTPYYGNFSGQEKFIKAFFKDGDAVVALHAPKSSNLIEKSNTNKIVVTGIKDGKLIKYFVNNVSEGEYDSLYKKYGYKE